MSLTLTLIGRTLGELTIIFQKNPDSNDKYQVGIGLTNNGFRHASNVKISGVWVKEYNGKFEKVTDFIYEFPFPFSPNETRYWVERNLHLSEEQRLQFENFYIALSIDYFDNLRGKFENTLLIGRQYKLDNTKLNLVLLVDEKLNSIKRFLRDINFLK